MIHILRLMRPHQYLKNTFIFAPLFFAAQGTDLALLLQALLAFIAFSLVASAVYVFNDYCDQQEDRLHPIKQYRPIASGKVTNTTALFTFSVLTITGFSLMFALSYLSVAVLFFYFTLNISYSLWFKHIVLIDIGIISLGFILRLFVGAYVCDISLSIWIILLTALLAIFLSLAKRRDDVLIFQRTGKETRSVIPHYKLNILNPAIILLSAIIIFSFVSYMISHPEYIQEPIAIILSSLLVASGLVRYLQVTFLKEQSGSPTQVVLNDHLLQFIIFIWLCVCTWILYI